MIVFSPYLFYKTQFFVPRPPLNCLFGILKFERYFSLEELFNIIFLKNTMLRMTYYNGIEARRLFSNGVVLTYYFVIYSALIYWVLKIFKKSIYFYKQELVIFVIFYIPAVFYEIVRPYIAHLW